MSEDLSPQRVRARLRRALTGEPPLQVSAEVFFGPRELKLAGVLMPMTERGGRMHMLFTRRSPRLRSHAGEISFPGGRHDPDDPDLIDTALRETREEIAIAPGDVEVYGQFARVPTISGYEIAAFAGEYPDPYELLLNPDEIDDVLELPLEQLADPAIHRMVEESYKGLPYAFHMYDVGGEQPIWGATAFILHEFLAWLRG